MKFLGIVVLFLGYVLVYAATAAHGRFTLHPWLGVVSDAYTGETITLRATVPGSSSSPAVAEGLANLAAGVAA